MKEWIRHQWHRYYKPFYRISAFVIAALLMVLSFPNVEKIQYEYELHRPWRHENVIAPFDFPIYKTDYEISAERDSILNNFRPYYRRDSISETYIQSNIDRMFESYHNKLTMICPATISTDSIQNIIKHILISIQKHEYAQGILELPIEEETQNKEFEFMVIEGNILEPYTLSEMLTMGEAYKQLTTELKNRLYKHFGNSASWIEILTERLPLSDLITTNIYYDAERTANERDERLSNMSISSGKVLAGQKIISTGDIVDKRTARLIESLKKASEVQYGIISRTTTPVFLGQFIVILGLLTTMFLFLKFFRVDVFERLRSINFIVLIMTLFVVGAGLIAQRHGNISFMIPFVVAPILLRTFLDSRLAMYAHTITTLIISFLAHNSQLFILLHIPAGMIAIITLINLSRRSQIIKTAIVVFITYTIIYVGYNIWQTGEYDTINPYVIAMFAINSLFMLLSYPLIYIFERLFGFISDVTLLELSDSNNTLLRQLSEKAPGTFQHSVQVGNLGQEVAIRIGANGMMVRAGAMYHDLGKIVTPGYFTENQVTGTNPHEGMDYAESAQMVIQHVKNGVKLAKKHNIPQQIIDIIRTHHGTSQALYFYRSWCNEHPNEKPDMTKFSYEGPLPYTKEQAIVMMADAVEASSKSLKEYTDQSIDELVEKIINMQIDSKQLANAPITFNDIKIAKEIFKEKLKNIYHSRIQYPELLK